jgi:hypothetical protein
VLHPEDLRAIGSQFDTEEALLSQLHSEFLQHTPETCRNGNLHTCWNHRWPAEVFDTAELRIDQQSDSVMNGTNDTATL